MLSLEGLEKRYGATRALAGVGFRLDAGEVLGLVGHNGAGKSTLIRILAGAEAPDAGTIRLDGAPVRFASPADAHAAGIRVIHQDAPLVPDFDTVDNCFLGRPYPRRLGRLDRRAMRAAVEAVAADIAPDLPLDTPVMHLGPARRQFVRLVRALADKGRLLVLDEPTAALPAEDAETFFDVLRRTRARGASIVLVSHRLDEIAGFCDRAVVLRDGALVAELDGEALTPPNLVRAMGGGATAAARPASPPGETVLEIDGLVSGELGTPATLAARAGEVIALYGLVGSGRSSLLEAICGATKIRAGTMRLAGRAYRPRSPGDAVRAGISLVPPDRHRNGLFLDEDLVFNATLPLLRHHRRVPGLPLPDRAAEREAFRAGAGAVDMSYGDARQLARTLSGGNQQKLLFSRWAGRHSRVMLLDEPTEGVDVMAKAAIRGIVRAIAGDGNAVLVSTSDRDEALELGDRVLVFRAGAVVAAFDRAGASAEALSAAAQTREPVPA